MKQPGEILLTISIDTSRIAELLPHAETAVMDGLLTFDEAVKMLAEECCLVEEKQ
jgi:hypothetical protein